MDMGSRSPEISPDRVAGIAYCVASTLDILRVAVDDPRKGRYLAFTTSAGNAPGAAVDDTPDVLTDYADRLYRIARRPLGRRDMPFLRECLGVAKQVAISLLPRRAIPYAPSSELGHEVAELIDELTTLERALDEYN